MATGAQARGGGGGHAGGIGGGNFGGMGEAHIGGMSEATSERWMERMSGVWAAIASATSGVATVLATATIHASFTGPLTSTRSPTATDRERVESMQKWRGARSEEMRPWRRGHGNDTVYATRPARSSIQSTKEEVAHSYPLFAPESQNPSDR